MRIYISESQLNKIIEQQNIKTAQEQLDEFTYYEDKVKSSFIGKKKVKLWYERLKQKYPNLMFRFQMDGDVIRAEAQINKNKISESVSNGKITCDNCGWKWDMSEGGDDMFVCHKCGHDNSEVEDLDEYVGKRVKVYYNLHKHTFSVTYKNKVIIHADFVKLGDVEFRVRPGGKDRVRKEKSKNVHAFVIGNLLDYCEFPCTNIPDESNERIVTYDPYKYDSFVYKSTKEPIYNASEVDMINKKNKLFVIQEVVKK